MRQRLNYRRAGFTLIEVLVVVVILGILLGMVIAAVFPSQNRQNIANTRALLKKLDHAILQQWSEALHEAKKSQIPPALVAMAVGTSSDPHARQKIARAIWVKIQMRAEFPMNYDEVRNPWYCFLGNATSQAWIPSGNNPATASIAYYQGAIAGKVSQNLDAEGSALLLLALQKPRAGRKYSVEDALGAGALRDTDGDGMKEIVDAWGTPVAFFRWATASPDRFPPNGAAQFGGLTPSGELNALNTNARGALDRDTEDLEHGLMDQYWNLSGAASPPLGVQVFQRHCHLIQHNNNRQSFYTEPVIVSAGRDRQFGLIRDTQRVYYNTAGYFVPSMTVALVTKTTPSGQQIIIPDEASANNIYSFKQR